MNLRKMLTTLPVTEINKFKSTSFNELIRCYSMGGWMFDCVLCVLCGQSRNLNIPSTFIRWKFLFGIARMFVRLPLVGKRLVISSMGICMVSGGTSSCEQRDDFEMRVTILVIECVVKLPECK